MSGSSTPASTSLVMTLFEGGKDFLQGVSSLTKRTAVRKREQRLGEKRQQSELKRQEENRIKEYTTTIEKLTKEIHEDDAKIQELNKNSVQSLENSYGEIFDLLRHVRTLRDAKIAKRNKVMTALENFTHQALEMEDTTTDLHLLQQMEQNDQLLTHAYENYNPDKVKDMIHRMNVNEQQRQETSTAIKQHVSRIVRKNINPHQDQQEAEKMDLQLATAIESELGHWAVPQCMMGAQTHTLTQQGAASPPPGTPSS